MDEDTIIDVLGEADMTVEEAEQAIIELFEEVDAPVKIDWSH